LDRFEANAEPTRERPWENVLVIKALAAASIQFTEFVVTISIERVGASPSMKGWEIPYQRM
jgi:hypothetical protein